LTSGSVRVTPSAPISAGEYYIVVRPSSDVNRPYGVGTVPDGYVTKPYTLVVTE